MALTNEPANAKSGPRRGPASEDCRLDTDFAKSSLVDELAHTSAEYRRVTAHAWRLRLMRDTLLLRVEAGER